MPAYTIGMDFGTNSLRVVIINVENGEEFASALFNYPGGTDGILLNSKEHNLARQSPSDYLQGLKFAVTDALSQARRTHGVLPDQVIGIGVDTTGSTPIPVDAFNSPMCFHPEYRDNLNAHAWLWKDHSAFAEAAEITTKAKEIRPHFLAKCGGVYSSEWYWAKLWHCLNVDPKLFKSTYAWIELEDFIPSVLSGITKPDKVVRGVCAAGHKAMYNKEWGGMPDAEFLAALAPELAELRKRMPDNAFSIDHKAGYLCEKWAKTLGLKPGIPIAVGAFDAHLGAVGSGVKKGTLVKIVGTSTCDIMVTPNTEKVPDIPGVCGIVDGSVLPGYYGIEAGQSAVGDIFHWFVNIVCEGDDTLQVKLTEQAKKLKPGESGLIALDWNNGNRTILVDPQLSGLLIGMTLHSNRSEIYRALLEATAFGALTIINRIEEYSIPIEQVICCGGISEKNELFMQIYADVLNRPIYISRSTQTCALGAAIAGALAGGAYKSIEDAIDAMTGVKDELFRPDSKSVRTYQSLYSIYKKLHDGFGYSDSINVSRVMKDLLQIRAHSLKT